jgi:uncharacterized repeat protein (TIGR01451 family)
MGIITGYNWTFGDGSSASAEVNPYHIYNNPGTYSVWLTVYGPGGTSSAVSVITVLPPSTLIPTWTYTPIPSNTPIPPTFTPTNTPTPTNTVVPQADLAVGMTVNDATPNEGDIVIFTVTVTNNGPNNTNGVRLRDTIQAGLTVTASNPSQGSYAGDVWTVGTLADGATATLTLNARVGAGTGGSTLTNTATITASSVSDPAAANNTDSASVNVQIPPLSADLAVGHIVNNGTPNELSTVTFRITVTNNGPNATNGVQVTDTPQAGLTIIGNELPTQGSYAGGVWTIGTLANGATATLDVYVWVGAGTGGSTLTNTATISASSVADPVGANNSAPASVLVVATADLWVSMGVDNATPNEGATVTYTITVANNGPAVSYGVLVTDTPEAGLTITGNNPPSQGSYAGGVWTVGTLANGALATLQLFAQVGAGTGGSILTNTVNVTSSVPDPDGGDDSASVDVSVQSVGMNPPVANDDTAVTVVGTPVTIYVLMNDTDPDGNINPASVVVLSGPNQGTTSVDPGTGAITYQPTGIGADEFRYQVCDTTGLCSATPALVRINTVAGEIIIIDNADATRVTINGAWDSKTSAQAWASGYLDDQNTGKGGKSVTFTPNLVGGTYRVYMWWPADAQNASNVVVEIHFDGGTTTPGANQQINGGQWNDLGALNFAAGTGGYVVITTTGTSGYVIADAVMFVREG